MQEVLDAICIKKPGVDDGEGGGGDGDDAGGVAGSWLRRACC